MSHPPCRWKMSRRFLCEAERNFQKNLQKFGTKGGLASILPVMKFLIFILCGILVMGWGRTYGQKTATSSLEVEDLKNFEANSPAVRKLLSDSLALTRRKLSYRYGSADPGRGGMDCSGFIHYVLIQQGLDKVPRMAHDFYSWVQKSGNLHIVKSTNPQSPEMHQLRPGDLLFWSGTYQVKRWPPITHVMIYLGRTVDTNNPVMVGASSGRRYQGRARHGVSVFDFRFPNPRYESGAKFVGYGAVPGLEQAFAFRQGGGTSMPTAR